jgi:hypothetical protein
VHGKAPLAVGPFGNESKEVAGPLEQVLGACGFGGGLAVNDKLVIGVLAGVVFIAGGGGFGVAGRSGAVRTAMACFIMMVFNCFLTAGRARGGIRVKVVVCVVAIGMRMVRDGDTASPPRFVWAANFGLTDTVSSLPPDVDDRRGIPVPFGRAATPGSYQGLRGRVVAGTGEGCDGSGASKERHDSPGGTAFD